MVLPQTANADWAARFLENRPQSFISMVLQLLFNQVERFDDQLPEREPARRGHLFQQANVLPELLKRLVHHHSRSVDFLEFVVALRPLPERKNDKS